MSFTDQHILFLDIETVPVHETFDALSESMQLLWQKKSKQILPEEANMQHSFFSKAGIYAEFGKIVCISVGYIFKGDDGETFRIKSLIGDENEILINFFKMISDFFDTNKKRFCGHNIKEFDIPFICRRAIINNIKLPTVLANLQGQKPWELPLIDTLQLWKFGDYKNYASLDVLANVLGVESSKSDIDGSEVAAVFYKEKDIERIMKYCARDVVTTARVYRRLIEGEMITDGQIEEK